jgi:hypothetical protein
MESRPAGPGEGSRASQRDWEPEAPYREPSILRYLRLLWGHRGLILVGSLLPTLLIALVLYLWPDKYTVTFFYERRLAETEYNVLLRRFRSQENLDKLVGRLQEQGLTRYVRKLDRAQTQESLDKLIRFEVLPAYPLRLQTTDPCSSERISAFRAKLLSVQITGSSAQEAAGAGTIVTANIEDILPLYDLRNYLKDSLTKLRGDAAKIEEDRSKLSFDLQKENAKLEKLKALAGAKDTPGETAPGGVILQLGMDPSRGPLPLFYPVQGGPPKMVNLQDMFSPGAEKYDLYEFLPLSYQIRAVESKIVDLQETLSSNTHKHDLDLQAVDLDNRLLTQVEANLPTYYTAQQYLGFVREQLRACEDPTLADYLRSCLGKMENLVLVNTRAGEKPAVYPVAKHILRNSVLTAVLGLMSTGLAAGVLEHRLARRRQLAAPGRPSVRSGVTTLGMSS